MTSSSSSSDGVMILWRGAAEIGSGVDDFAVPKLVVGGGELSVDVAASGPYRPVGGRVCVSVVECRPIVAAGATRRIFHLDPSK
jgi:hypothetical protein